jgi:hypothetical protein
MGKGKNDEEQVDISQNMKSKVQPSQDNRDPMVKNFENGATVTMDKGVKKKLKPTIKSSLIYT